MTESKVIGGHIGNVTGARQRLYTNIFVPVCQVFARLAPPLNLTLETARFAYWVRNTAQKRAADRTHKDEEPLREWMALAAKYPRLENSGYMRLIEAQHWLRQHLMWRFAPDARR